MIVTQTRSAATAADFVASENSASGAPAAGFTARANTIVLVTAAAISAILSQNDSAVNSRTGSPTISVSPVTAMTTSPHHIHGANRRHTASKVSSVRTRPSTRSAIIN